MRLGRVRWSVWFGGFLRPLILLKPAIVKQVTVELVKGFAVGPQAVQGARTADVAEEGPNRATTILHDYRAPTGRKQPVAVLTQPEDPLAICETLALDERMLLFGASRTRCCIR